MGYGYLKELDDFFCARYSDYVRIAAIEGFRMPEMIVVDRDGNINRRDSEKMRLSEQPERDKLLQKFKEELADVEFTFDFSFPSFLDRVKDPFRKHTFSKYFPKVLQKYRQTSERVGKGLTVEPMIWEKILRGTLYPEKNVIMAIALFLRMELFDINNLYAVCGFEWDPESVRDVVFEYLITQKIFNPEMIRACLNEYRIETIPIAF